MSIARGGLNQDWDVVNVTTHKKKRAVRPVGRCSLCVFQEVLDFELRLQNWSATIERKMLEIEGEEVAEDEEQLRLPYLKFKLGKGWLRSASHRLLGNKKATKSSIFAMRYSSDEVKTEATFHVPHSLTFHGTRTELEEKELKVKVFCKTRLLAQDMFIGDGRIPLSGSAGGAALWSNIAWRSGDAFESAGRVQGSSTSLPGSHAYGVVLSDEHKAA